MITKKYALISTDGRGSEFITYNTYRGLRRTK